MSEFAELTGNSQDIPGYKELATQIKTAYNNTYFKADSAMYDNNTVTANMLSLRPVSYTHLIRVSFCNIRPIIVAWHYLLPYGPRAGHWGAPWVG